MGLKEVSDQIPYARRADPLPAVLARVRVFEHLLKAVTDLQMRTAFITVYAEGLRVSEVVKLTGRDIDSARMVIVIRQSKGRKTAMSCCPSSCSASSALIESGPILNIGFSPVLIGLGRLRRARGFVQQGFRNASQWSMRGLALDAGRRRNLIIAAFRKCSVEPFPTIVPLSQNIEPYLLLVVSLASTVN